MDRTELEKYITEEYGAEAEFPWEKYPDYSVYRHKGNRKWFALIMNIPKEKLDPEKSGNTNVKAQLKQSAGAAKQFEGAAEDFISTEPRDGTYFGNDTAAMHQKLSTDAKCQADYPPRSREHRAVIINVKCDPIMIGSLRMEKGFYPAYHMDKDHWGTVDLSEVENEKIKWLIDISYELTAPKIKKSKKAANVKEKK